VVRADRVIGRCVRDWVWACAGVALIAGCRLSHTVSSVSHDDIVGEEPLADGMHIVIRLRRDFVVTDAARLLAAARAAYARANPGTGPQDAAAAVTSAADAVFTILEDEGLLGGAADRALAARASDGLEPGP
jgi:hypothetical protein